ncbi:MAG TPA: DUF1847 domain-containing protein [Syntrophorhabdaceae bacterium]|jgi:uncharacterized metal-binding protein
MKKGSEAECASCAVIEGERACMVPGGKAGKGCPTVGRKKLLKKALEEYKTDDLKEFARLASVQEGECYSGRDRQPFVMHPVKPRIVETMEFAKKMGYVRLGLVFCGGLANEAAAVARIFENHGFTVVSVVCKAGAVPKEEIGLKDKEKVHWGEHESMCNPIFQAMVLNEGKTDFNVLLGLCVGHDSMYFKFAEAPTTVLAVKDRVTGHNPLSAIYLSDKYYSWVMEP